MTLVENRAPERVEVLPWGKRGRCAHRDGRLTALSGPVGKASQVCSRAQGRPGCTWLSAACRQGDRGEWGSEDGQRRQLAPGFLIPDSGHRGRRGGQRVGEVIRKLDKEGFIPELSKFTLSSQRNQTLITRAGERKRKKPD